jgi:transitional endoplasmic reticulum ATPase
MPSITNNGTDNLADAIERGMARARRDDWSGAVEAFRRAVSLDSQDVESRFRLGWAIWNRSEIEKPNMADLVVGYGAQVLGVEPVARDRGRKFRHHKEMLHECAHWLREAIARDAKHARSHYYLAQALKGLGQKEEATETAKKAVEIEPENQRFATLVQAYANENRPLFSEVHPPDPEAAKLTWNDLILAPKTKRELRQMQLMLERPDLAQELGVDPPTGILLKGAPGTGKTTIARVLANEAKCKFYSITPADINQMYVGESEKRVRDLFSKARTNAPSIIFIDEIDALLPERSGGVAIHSDKVVNQFLQEMDGMKSNARVFIVGATNRPDMLDPAVRRGGRLSREIQIPLPDKIARLEMLKLFTQHVKLAPDVDLEALAGQTENYSGADIKAVVNEAGLQALIRVADSTEPDQEKMLTSADFKEAVANLQES